MLDSRVYLMILAKSDMEANVKASAIFFLQRRQKDQIYRLWLGGACVTPLLLKLARGRYAMAEYERIKRITFPLEDYHLLLITTEVNADHGKIINKVLDMIKK